jgi:hypothetical protein
MEEKETRIEREMKAHLCDSVPWVDFRLENFGIASPESEIIQNISTLTLPLD